MIVIFYNSILLKTPESQKTLRKKNNYSFYRVSVFIDWVDLAGQ